MSASTASALPALGFLTVLEKGERGLLGGLLVLNAAGRPLEFHCTAPVKANRAQEILYGPTLQPYLYGEQIGQALYRKCKAELQFLFTDVPDVLALRDFTNLPVTWVVAGRANGNPATPRQIRLDAPHEGPRSAAPASRTDTCEIAGHTLATSRAYANDRSLLLEKWEPHAEDFDLFEPFDRIREAIEEAQRAAR